MSKIVIPFLALLCAGCTYSISLVHTEGQASDIIDENQTANPNISPNLNIPLK
jgi:hypothetical protein